MASIGTLLAYLKVDTTGLTKASVAMKKYTNNATKGFKSVGKAATSLQGVLAGMGVTLAAGKIVSDVLKIGTAFEQTMATVGGVMRATDAEFKRLEASARHMGETTEWSATQSAEALKFLGMAGFNAEKAIAALPGTLNLATASAIDLGRAADISSNILSSFQLDVEKLAHVNDVLVGTITRTNTDMEMMAESMKYAGATANSFGYSIEETSAMVGLLGNAGIQGCYDEETEVLTKDGFKRWKDVTDKDIFATINQTTKEIEYQAPTKMFRYWHSGKMYVVKNKHIDLKVTPNHQMYVRRRDHEDFELLRADQIYGKSVEYLATGNWIGQSPDYETLPGFGQHRGSWIKTIGKKYIPMDLWCEFLGYYISEGSCDYNKGSYRVRISQKKGTDKYDTIHNFLKKFPFHFNAHQQGFTIIDQQLYKSIKNLGYSYDKHIPTDIKELSPRLLEILYDAMVLGDGDINGAIYTASTQLRDDIQEICLKIGWGSSSRLVTPKGTKVYIKDHWATTRADNWKVNVNKKHLTPSFYQYEYTPGTVHGDRIKGLGKTVVEEWQQYDGFVYCAEVPNHTLVVRRNGKVIVCGNSMAGTQLAFAFQKVGDVFKSVGMSGEGKNFIDALELINERQMTTTEILDIFGQRGGRAVLVLKDMITQYGDLKTALDQSSEGMGEAARLADVMRNTVGGAFKELKSKIESVAIDAFNKYKVELKAAIKDTTAWISEHKDEILAWVSDAGKSIKGFIQWWQKADKAVMTFHRDVLQAADDIAQAVLDMGTFFKNFDQTMDNLITNAISGFQDLAVKGLGLMIEGLIKAKSVISFFNIGWLELKVGAMGTLGALMDGLADLIERLRFVLKPLNAIFEGLVKIGVLDVNPIKGAIDSVTEKLRGYGDKSGEVAAKVRADIETIKVKHDEEVASLEAWKDGIFVMNDAVKGLSAELQTLGTTTDTTSRKYSDFLNSVKSPTSMSGGAGFADLYPKQGDKVGFEDLYGSPEMYSNALASHKNFLATKAKAQKKAADVAISTHKKLVEERKKIQADYEEYETTVLSGTFEYEMKKLEEKYNAYKKITKDLNKLDKWLFNEKKKLIDQAADDWLNGYIKKIESAETVMTDEQMDWLEEREKEAERLAMGEYKYKVKLLEKERDKAIELGNDAAEEEKIFQAQVAKLDEKRWEDNTKLAQNHFDSIGDMAQSVLGTIDADWARTLDKMLGGLGDVFGQEGIGKVFNDLLGKVGGLGGGIFDKLLGDGKGESGILGGLLDPIMNLFGGKGGSDKGLIGSLVGDISSALGIGGGGFLDGILDSLGGLGSSISEGISSIAGGASSMLGGLGGAFSSVFDLGMEYLSTGELSRGSIGSAIGSAVGSFLGPIGTILGGIGGGLIADLTAPKKRTGVGGEFGVDVSQLGAGFGFDVNMIQEYSKRIGEEEATNIQSAIQDQIVGVMDGYRDLFFMLSESQQGYILGQIDQIGSMTFDIKAESSDPDRFQRRVENMLEEIPERMFDAFGVMFVPAIQEMSDMVFEGFGEGFTTALDRESYDLYEKVKGYAEASTMDFGEFQEFTGGVKQLAEASSAYNQFMAYVDGAAQEMTRADEVTFQAIQGFKQWEEQLKELGVDITQLANYTELLDQAIENSVEAERALVTEQYQDLNQDITRSFADMMDAVSPIGKEIMNINDSFDDWIDQLKELEKTGLLIADLETELTTIEMQRAAALSHLITQEEAAIDQELSRKIIGRTNPMQSAILGIMDEFDATIQRIQQLANVSGRTYDHLIAKARQWQSMQLGDLIAEKQKEIEGLLSSSSTAGSYSSVAQGLQTSVDNLGDSTQNLSSIISSLESVMKSIDTQILDMQTTGISPASAPERLDILRQEIEGFGAVTSPEDITKMQDLLKRYMGLAGETYQRPSGEYGAIYEDVLGRLQGLKTQASTIKTEYQLQQDQVELQKQTLAAVQTGNTYAGSSLSVGNDSLSVAYQQLEELKTQKMLVDVNWQGMSGDVQGIVDLLTMAATTFGVDNEITLGFVADVAVNYQGDPHDIERILDVIAKGTGWTSQATVQFISSYASENEIPWNAVQQFLEGKGVSAQNILTIQGMFEASIVNTEDIQVMNASLGQLAQSFQTLATGGGVEFSMGQGFETLHWDLYTNILPELQAIRGNTASLNAGLGFTSYGDGGISWGPEIALVGEKGPEAHIPLADLGSIISNGGSRGSGGDMNMSFTFNITGDNPKQTAAEVKTQFIQILESPSVRSAIQEIQEGR